MSTPIDSVCILCPSFHFKHWDGLSLRLPEAELQHISQIIPPLHHPIILSSSATLATADTPAPFLRRAGGPATSLSLTSAYSTYPGIFTLSSIHNSIPTTDNILQTCLDPLLGRPFGFDQSDASIFTP